MTQDAEPHDIKTDPLPSSPPTSPAGVGDLIASSEKTSPEKESEIWAGRICWKHYSANLLLAVLWSIVAIVLAWKFNPPWFHWTILGATLCAWFYIFVKMLYGILSHRYRLTTERLFSEQGLLSRTIDQTELIRVDDVRIFQTLLDRILKIGTVEILSTDQTNRTMKLVGIESPQSLADHIRENVQRLRNRSLYVKQL